MLLKQALKIVLSKTLTPNSSRPQWLSTPHTFYGSNKVRYSSGIVGYYLCMHCWSADMLWDGLFFPQPGPRPYVDCFFLRGREGPRCSWGEIYASGSCRNADFLGNQKIFLFNLRPLYIDMEHDLNTVVIPWVAAVTVSYPRAQKYIFFSMQEILTQHGGKKPH